MRSFSQLVWSLATILMIAQPAAAQAPRDSANVALIRQLLDETHTLDHTMAAMEANISAQRAANPNMPAAFWDRFLSLAQARRDTLTNMFVEIYSRHFSADDVKQLLDFYRSPVGRKMAEETPAIGRESMLAGQALGAQLAADVARQLAKEGIPLPLK